MKKFLSVLFLVFCSVVHAQVYNRNSVDFPKTGTFRLDAATQTRAGAMSALDKQKLDTLTGGVGSVKAKVSIAQLRSLTGQTLESVIKTQINAVDGNWYYDPLDKTTPDNGATVVVTVDSSRLKRFVESFINVEWFGATRNDGTDDYAALKKAIDYVIYNAPNRLYIPAGQFHSSHGLNVWKDANNDGNPEQVFVIIEGAGIALGAGLQETSIIFTDNKGYGINIQKGKGCQINNLNIIGRNTLNFNTVAQVWDPAATYVVNGCRTNKYTPYAGLNLDRFGYVPTDEDKDPTDFHKGEGVIGKGGSTDCSFRNLNVTGWVVDIILSPNAQTQNNESHVFDGIWLGNCKDGFVTTNSQERVVVCNNFKIWNCVQTCFRTTGYGQNRGDVPKISNLNVAGSVFQLFVFSGTGGYFANVKITGVHAESIYRIGHIDALSVKFEDFHFNFGDPTTIGMKVQSWLYEGAYTEFNNGVMLYYNGSPNVPLRFKNNNTRNFKFENVMMQNPVSFSSAPVSEEDIFSNYAEYHNCTFYSSTPTYKGNGYSSGFYNQFGLDLINKFDYVKLGSGGTYILNTVTSPISKLSGVMEGRGTAVTVNADSANITSSYLANFLSVGDCVYVTEGALTSAYGDHYSEGQIGTVRRLSGNNITLGFVVDGMVTGTYYLKVGYLQNLRKGFVCKTNSTTKLLFTSGTKPGVGDRLSGPGIATGSKVTSVVADSIYIYPPATVTQNDMYYNTYLHTQTGEVYGDPASTTLSSGVICVQGTILKNTKPSDTTKAWLCIKSGTFGSVHPPTFKPL